MKHPELLTPAWEDYELIDCGDFEKLERFGRYITRRPEPQAIWHRTLPEGEWSRLATASFVREKGGGEERGKWSLKPTQPDQWFVSHKVGGRTLRMRLGLTSFKHVGLFPEQAENWDFIFRKVQSIAKRRGGGEVRPKVLNMFAYTGGASLAAAAAGADVTHVDSVKQCITWARENAEASHIEGVRWVVEDALKFARREVKRGHRYDGIILDPPAYGRGPEGEKWVLEQNIAEMLALCAELLAEGGFLVLNLYSMGLSALLAKSAVNQLIASPSEEQFGELYFTDRSGKSLPLGVYYRCVK
ncbi:MAG: class I SAM-dependent methyltransferase [Tidjanibacter sp.]|nr:class I SAM-dependent methyltransferase [Tidjanibacter sp.]